MRMARPPAITSFPPPGTGTACLAEDGATRNKFIEQFLPFDIVRRAVRAIHDSAQARGTEKLLRRGEVSLQKGEL